MSRPLRWEYLRDGIGHERLSGCLRWFKLILLVCIFARTLQSSESIGSWSTNVEFAWRPTLFHSARIRRDGQFLSRRAGTGISSVYAAARFQMTVGHASLPIAPGGLPVDTGVALSANIEQIAGWTMGGRNATVEKRSLGFAFGAMTVEKVIRGFIESPRTNSTSLGNDEFRFVVLSAELFQRVIRTRGRAMTDSGVGFLIEPIGWKAARRFASLARGNAYLAWGIEGSGRMGGGGWADYAMGWWDYQLNWTLGAYGVDGRWGFALGISMGGYRMYTSGSHGETLQSAWASGLMATLVIRN